MENGRMGSKRDISTDSNRFIMISGKGIKSCFNADSTKALQGVDNSKSASSVITSSSVLESNFAKCKGSTIGDGNEFACAANGEDLSFDRKTRSSNTSKTSSSQCNTNSQNACCRIVENSSSCLTTVNHESASKSQITSLHCSEFINVISSEIATNLRITEEMNGASCENDVAQKKSLVDYTNPVPSNTNCNIGEALDNTCEISYISYESENQMPDIMKLIQKDLSEPYSIYTYRYFIHNWPHLCFLAVSNGKSVGAIVCKLDLHRKIIKRGYIAMLAVDECFRKKGIGSNLVLKAIRVMASEGADEVVLETEITNQPALRLYENLGFVRDKRLFRYYLNGVDALRLKLWLR